MLVVSILQLKRSSWETELKTPPSLGLPARDVPPWIRQTQAEINRIKKVTANK